MAMSRKDKKRIATYAAGAAAAALRGAIKSACFVAKTGFGGGAMLNTMLLGSAISMTDQLLGTHSPSIVGDEMLRGCSAILNNGADWGGGMLTRGVNAAEKFAKKQIIYGNWFGR